MIKIACNINNVGIQTNIKLNNDTSKDEKLKAVIPPEINNSTNKETQNNSSVKDDNNRKETDWKEK